MSWREREYHQESWGAPTGGPVFRWPPPVAGALILLHIAAFVLLQLLLESEPDVAAPLALSNERLRPVAILLHPLAATAPFSLILTVAFIWLLGGRIERQYGRKPLLTRYVAGNLAAGMACFLIGLAYRPLVGVALDYPAGALSAWALFLLRPNLNEHAMILGKPRHVGRLMLIIIAVLFLLTLILRGVGAVGWIGAILAGAAAEQALSAKRQGRWPALRRRGPRLVKPRREKPALEIDDILSKISTGGIDSLTSSEKARLEKARRQITRNP